MSKVDFNKEIIDEIKNFISANNNKKLKETLKIEIVIQKLMAKKQFPCL